MALWQKSCSAPAVGKPPEQDPGPACTRQLLALGGASLGGLEATACLVQEGRKGGGVLVGRVRGQAAHWQAAARPGAEPLPRGVHHLRDLQHALRSAKQGG